MSRPPAKTRHIRDDAESQNEARDGGSAAAGHARKGLRVTTWRLANGG